MSRTIVSCKRKPTVKHSKSKVPLSQLIALIGGTGVALASLTLGFFGYGVALAIQNMFDIPLREIAPSSSDYLALSAEGIAFLTLGILKVFNLPDFWLAQLKKGGEVFLLASVCGAIILVFLFIKKRISKKRKLENFFSKLKLAVREKSWRRKLLILALAIAAFLFPIVGCLLFAALVFFVFILLSAIPMIGMAAGEVAYKETIIQGTCKEHYSADDYVKKTKENARKNDDKYGVTCVRIFEKDAQGDYKKAVAEGQVIVSNQERMFIYERSTGKTLSIPIRDRKIETINLRELTVRDQSGKS